MPDSIDKRALSTSDSPRQNLLEQREAFLQSLGIGTRLSEEMVSEYKKLVTQMQVLESQNARLRAALETNSALRELISKIDRLEREKEELLQRFRHVEASSTGFSDRFVEIETELGNLANLLVASRQLHASLSPRSVMRRIKEVLAQLVGAERYAIYFVNGDASALVPIASEGLRGEELVNCPTKEGPLGEAFRSGRSIVVDDMDPSQGTLSQPPAVIPLLVDEKPVGVIAVYSTLAQKTRFDTVDYELFNLLGTQAGWALVGATLFVAAEHRLPGLEAFVDLSV